jgi:hypothetical protein
MSGSSQVNDLLITAKTMQNHEEKFILWPEKWAVYTNMHTWYLERLDRTRRNSIPDSPGIYTLLLQPGIAGHSCSSYLMYVGKAKSLKVRFNDYLMKERGKHGRPPMILFFNKYDPYIWFYYTLVPANNLGAVEDGLLEAYIPPLNQKIKGTVGRARSAFR